MHSKSGRYVIVFNGEIYNFRALRSELEKRGHDFQSRSDTEVILASVMEWGLVEALRRFNGMFAFALWDRNERVLYLTRDRFGEKPLYYGWFDRALVFGSELKALRAYPSFGDTIDRDALALYMRYGYVPTPYCIYRSVRKLPAGTVLKVRSDPLDYKRSPDVYWSAIDTALASIEAKFRGSMAEAANELECLLEDAVRLRLESDVPLGAFLSGGIDSSTVVAIMQRQVAQPVQTFTIGFSEAPYNEAEDAKRVAEHLGTRHTELYVSPSDAIAVVPRLPALYDEPFADSSQIPTFLISSLARRHVTVSLSGDGGDELFGGYNRYRLASDRWRLIFRSPPPLRRFISRLLKTLPPRTWDWVYQMVTPSSAAERHIGDKLHRLGDVFARTGLSDTYNSVVSLWDVASDVVHGTSAAAARPIALPDSVNNLIAIHKMLLLDAVAYLPDDILVKVDRATMGVSLEARVPFLDPRVAQFCWSIPPWMRMQNGRSKWLLRQVLSKYVPQHLFDRPKAGFAVPIGTWLRGPLKTWAEDLLSDGRLRMQGFLNAAPIRSLWQRHLAERENGQDRLWSALMFESWLDEQHKLHEGPE